MVNVGHWGGGFLQPFTQASQFGKTEPVRQHGSPQVPFQQKNSFAVFLRTRLMARFAETMLLPSSGIVLVISTVLSGLRSLQLAQTDCQKTKLFCAQACLDRSGTPAGSPATQIIANDWNCATSLVTRSVGLNLRYRWPGQLPTTTPEEIRNLPLLSFDLCNASNIRLMLACSRSIIADGDLLFSRS